MINTYALLLFIIIWFLIFKPSMMQVLLSK